MDKELNFIFDFDGTLVNSFHAVIDKFNGLADEFGYLAVEESEIDKLRDLSSLELVNYFQIPLYKIPQVIRKVRKQLSSEMSSLLPFANLPEVLHELHSSKICLGILTSNSAKNVTSWLDCHHLRHLFHFVRAGSSFFGKRQLLNKIISSNKMDTAKSYYIGDETRDIMAAKECGVHSVAVTWGFNSEKILLEHEPHFIVRKPEDILSICKRA